METLIGQAIPGTDAGQRFAETFGPMALFALLLLVGFGAFVWVLMTRLTPKQIDELRADHRTQMDAQREADRERTSLLLNAHQGDVRRLEAFIAEQRTEFAVATARIAEANAKLIGDMVKTHADTIARMEAQNQRVNDELVRRLDVMTRRQEAAIKRDEEGG